MIYIAALVAMFIMIMFIIVEIGDFTWEETHSPIDPIYLAEYIIWYAKHQLHTLVDKDKIIAILYVAQGVFLSEHNRELFNEDFEAWTRGPILPSVYFNYKIFGSSKIPLGPLWNQETYDMSALSSNELKDLNEIIEKAMPYAGFRLIENFSKQSPWKKNHIYSYDNIPRKIPKSDIKEFFDECK